MDWPLGQAPLSLGPTPSLPPFSPCRPFPPSLLLPGPPRAFLWPGEGLWPSEGRLEGRAREREEKRWREKGREEAGREEGREEGGRLKGKEEGGREKRAYLALLPPPPGPLCGASSLGRGPPGSARAESTLRLGGRRLDWGRWPGAAGGGAMIRARGARRPGGAGQGERCWSGRGLLARARGAGRPGGTLE